MKTLAVFVVVFLCSSAAVFGEDPLTVGLFYESYCPDCIQFVNDQLVKVYKLFVDHLQLQLLPYGNAHQKYVDDHWEFKCQHGPRECLANKLHACAIYQACGDAGTVSCSGTNVTHVLKYISCVMKQNDQLEATSQCSRSSKLDADNMISCAKGDQGDELLNLYGNLTETLAPWKKGVPSVTINGKHDTAAEDNLMDILCQLKPAVCNNTSTEPDPDVEVFHI